MFHASKLVKNSKASKLYPKYFINIPWLTPNISSISLAQPKYFINILALPDSRSFVMLFSRI